MDVVVVGGGIVGLASAYYLAERGASVTVCEKGSLGGGSTGRAVGGIRGQYSTAVNVELSLASFPVWESFESKFGVDIAYRRTGYLFLARSADTAAVFRENVRMQNDRGVPSEYITPDAARDYCPGLRADAFVAGTYSPTDGFADPHLALQGFANAARNEGVVIRTGVAVTDVRGSANGVSGVVTGDGAIDADLVVNAAGPWARHVAAMAGIDIPVAPKRRQVLVVDPDRPVPEDVPLTIDLDGGSYFRPEREGVSLVGGHFSTTDPDVDPDTYTESFDLDWAAEALERAAGVAAYFGPESRIRRGWAGLYAVTPDHHPIIEETIPGFVNVVGFSGHGFQHAPATGRIVTELAFDGAASLVDVGRLGTGRFETGNLVHERNVA